MSIIYIYTVNMDISYNIPTTPNTIIISNDILNTPTPPPVVRQPATLHLTSNNNNNENNQDNPIQRQLIF